MQIIAHRGYWITQDRKNSMEAFQRAFDCGFGVELDFRDFNGELVISHNIADARSLKAREFFTLYTTQGKGLPIAINIKADGLQDFIEALLTEFHVENYFLFDMSIPEMVLTRERNLKFYTRQSDVERQCTLYTNASGVWIDSFYSEDWLTKEIIEEHLEAQKRISIISPELHGRDKYGIWEMLKSAGFASNHFLGICTDTPKEAEEYFND